MQECNAGYGFSTEDDGEFYTGWAPAINMTMRKLERKGNGKLYGKVMKIHGYINVSQIFIYLFICLIYTLSEKKIG